MKEQPTQALQVLDSSPLDLTTIEQSSVQARVMELLELFLEELSAAPDIPIQQLAMLESAAPLLSLMIAQIETSKLTRLINCLSAMLQVVARLDYSQYQYEVAIKPVLLDLVDVAQSLSNN